mgnify:CR=1 FL=1
MASRLFLTPGLSPACFTRSIAADPVSLAVVAGQPAQPSTLLVSLGTIQLLVDLEDGQTQQSLPVVASICLLVAWTETGPPTGVVMLNGMI